MLSRTARLAALITFTSAGLLIAEPNRAAASTPFACGDDGLHICCIDSGGYCGGGQRWCCIFDSRALVSCECA